MVGLSDLKAIHQSNASSDSEGFAFIYPLRIQGYRDFRFFRVSRRPFTKNPFNQKFNKDLFDTMATSGSEVCRAFRNTGRCRNGDDCKYEHSTGDVIAPPPAGPCFNFRDAGNCEFGDRCRFTHGESDVRFDENGRRKKQERAPRAPKVEGAAEGGAVKPKKKRKPRTNKPRSTEKIDEVCNNYLAGKCRYGDNCRRQHEGDIPQVNIPPRRNANSETAPN